MIKTFSFQLFVLILSILMVISLFGCANQSQDEKARETLLKTVDQLLDGKITFEKAKEKIERISIPADTALGYAMTKYKNNILSTLESQNIESLKSTREILANFHEHKDSDVYYKAFQDQFKNNDNLRDYKAFMDEFHALLSKLPNYEVTQLSETELDLGCAVHTYTVNSTQFDDSYSLSIETDKDQKITQVKLSRERKKSTNGNFTVFSAYVYRCMGFEIENNDYEAFYQKFDLRSEEKIYKTFSVGDYQITSMTVDMINKIVFSVTAK